MGNDDNTWDKFDPDHWNDAADESANNGMLSPALADMDDEAGATTPGAGGRWVARGGVMRWEPDRQSDDGSEAPLRDDAKSAWADDQIALPLGAPPQARLRSVRAWMARRRLQETELIGALLSERRRLAGRRNDDDDDSAPPERPDDPIGLALTEAQAAADEYETLLGLLEEIRAHVGPQGALVEFYLTLTERLATLAAYPAAADGFAESALFAEIERQPGEVTSTSRSEWEGRAGAALAVRRRVEQVSATEPEDD